MQFRLLLQIACGFLTILLVTVLNGCSSSDELFGPEISVKENDNAGDNLKLTIATDYTGTCPLTSIVFKLPKASHVYFEITNATGYHVRTLVDDYLEAGAHIVSWDGTNDDGEGINSGIYLFHLVASDFETWQASSVVYDVDYPGVE